MHEMALAESVLHIIQQSALSQVFQKVRSIELEIGQLSAVEPDALRFCFDAITRHTLAEGASLKILQTAGRGVCLDCKTEFAMQEQYGLCPACDSPHLQIIAGQKMRVKTLEVE